ncbi:MAG: twin-arginine translocase TatA/TatE family subunit [Balneolaceae bacterium]
MGAFGGFEWLIIIMIIIFFFGAKKFPEVARGIGQGVVEFRRARRDDKKDEKLSEEEKESTKDPEIQNDNNNRE